MNEISNKWIGKNTIRPDGADKVTGRAQYSSDTTMPGMIWGHVLRSPHPHARILSINTEKAEELDGVKAVITSKDVVDFPIDTPVILGIQDMRWMCRNVMARDKVLFHGHPLAAVAATTEEIAEKACELIEVEYEVLPWAIEIDDAIKPGAPILHDHIQFEGKPSNIAGTLEHKQSNIRAIPAEIGGGFGGKTIVYLEPLATILSQKTGRPVKIVMNREDTMRASGPTSGSKSKIKIGATKDGKIVAAQGTYYLQAGAFPGSPIRGAVGCSLAPYDIPNAHTFGYDVVSNRCKVAAYRAPGAPIGAYGVECVLDEIAEKLNICPLELRKINAAKEGTQAVHGPTYPQMGYLETVEAAINHPHYKAPLGKHQGRGVASGFWFNAGGESSAQLNITEDGNVVVTTGHPDIGGSRASIANITAELLGIHHDKVSVLIGDTATIGYSNLTGGSRVLFASAMVVTESAKIVIKQLKQRAAKIWGIDEEAIDWENGEARPAGDNAGKFAPLTLAELAEKATATGGPIGAGYQVNTEGAEGGFATHICDVEVDMDLGIVRVKRYTSIQDVGKAIHPDYVEGQLHGGCVQGIGWALSEEYIYNKDGHLDNTGFLDYRMPVCSDLPMLDTVLIEIPNPKHPQGVRGVGEVPLVPPLAAISNAVYQAIGKRSYSLPMSPPKVLKIIEGN